MLHADTGLWKLYAQLYWHRLNIVLAQTEYCIPFAQKKGSRLAHFFTSENLYAGYMKQQYVFPHVYRLGAKLWYKDINSAAAHFMEYSARRPDALPASVPSESPSKSVQFKV
jgi:hypothetical protein